MKKKLSMLSLLGAVAILIGGAVILSSCEGPEGPQGPAGTNGVDGVDGIDGQDGQDANATCTLCHSDDQVIVAKSRQYANSKHSWGDASGYGNRTFGPLFNCSECHTSQGFVDLVETGAGNPPYADITQPNCYTCHNIHDTYTEDDWTLTHPDATDPASGSVAVDLGNGNQCTSCHQIVGEYLAIDSLWLNFDDGGLTTVTLDASYAHAGPHHAPQYNTFTGMDLFEFTGSENYPSDAHPMNQTSNGCVECHMDDAFGDLTGHSMNVMYEFHGRENSHWPESCTTCHTPGGGLDLDDVYTDVTAETESLIAQLGVLLEASGIIVDGSLQTGVFTTDLFAAYFNYEAAIEDRSGGFHNPEYIQAVLANTIEAITPAPAK